MNLWLRVLCRSSSKATSSGIRHYPPWSPSLTAQQRLWKQQQQQQQEQRQQPQHQEHQQQQSAQARAGTKAGGKVPTANVEPPQTAVPLAEQPAAAEAAAEQPAAAEAAAGAAETAACAGWCSASESAEAPSFSLVEQDSSMRPAKRPPNFQELKIYALAPNTIRFGPDPQVCMRLSALRLLRTTLSDPCTPDA
eukprot:scaffold100066_cov20-Tisochrysis_lutea.AAC.1